MAHTYTITSIERVGDIATVHGTVDGNVTAAITSWATILSFPNATAFQNFIAPLLLASSILIPPIIDNTHNGNFTQ